MVIATSLILASGPKSATTPASNNTSNPELKSFLPQSPLYLFGHIFLFCYQR
ncbi:hypothetical protein FEDK69T_22600 [Flavobacterium enshiense DK69]|nr:hypothetical protein FEDK69T_22600 [Flavobacterium enshiense DK69]